MKAYINSIIHYLSFTQCIKLFQRIVVKSIYAVKQIRIVYLLQNKTEVSSILYDIASKIIIIVIIIVYITECLTIIWLFV